MMQLTENKTAIFDIKYSVSNKVISTSVLKEGFVKLLHNPDIVMLDIVMREKRPNEVSLGTLSTGDSFRWHDMEYIVLVKNDEHIFVQERDSNLVRKYDSNTLINIY